MVSVARLVEHVEHFQRRVLQDALNEACAGYWRRRAEQFELVGTAACDEVARACRNRALLAEIGDEEDLLLGHGEDLLRADRDVHRGDHR